MLLRLVYGYQKVGLVCVALLFGSYLNLNNNYRTHVTPLSYLDSFFWVSHQHQVSYLMSDSSYANYLS